MKINQKDKWKTEIINTENMKVISKIIVEKIISKLKKLFLGVFIEDFLSKIKINKNFSSTLKSQSNCLKTLEYYKEFILNRVEKNRRNSIDFFAGDVCGQIIKYSENKQESESNVPNYTIIDISDYKFIVTNYSNNLFKEKSIGFNDVSTFLNNGPILLGMDFNGYLDENNFYRYVLKDKISKHAVLIVGKVNGNDKSYFIVQNSWGSDWGIDGYFFLENSDFEKNININITLIDGIENKIK
jgi:hypothetical protein